MKYMNKSSKSVLLRAIATVCFLGFYAAYSQTSDISITIDLAKKEIVTFVKLDELPLDIDIVWQQRIPQGTYYMSSASTQNPEGQMIVFSLSKHLHTSVMSFSFVCKIDSIGETLSWGESALIYTDTASNKRIINFPPKIFTVAEHLTDSIPQILIPIDNSEKGKESASDEAVVSNEEEEVVPAESLVNKEDREEMPAEIVINKEKQAIAPTEMLVSTEEQTVTPIASSEEPVQVVVQEEPPKSIPAPIVQQESPEPPSGYYIQVSAFKTKRNLSEVKEYIHILKEDDLVEMKKEKFYAYLVGPFSTKKAAADKLEQHYKKYVPDAYVIKL